MNDQRVQVVERRQLRLGPTTATDWLARMPVGRRHVPEENLPLARNSLFPFAFVQDPAPGVFLDADVGLPILDQVAVQLADLVAGDQFRALAR